jgi:hypothetical protein
MFPTNSRARRRFSAIWIKALLGDLEGIDGVGYRRTVQTGFEPLAIHDVDWPRKQFGYVPLETGISEQVEGRIRFQLDQDIDIAGRLGFASGGRAKQGRMLNSSIAEFSLMSPQSGDDLVSVHFSFVSQNPPNGQLIMGYVRRR